MTARLERIVATAASRAHASAIDTSLAQEIIRGLSSSPKTLPAKAFYDPMGALLFERICGLPEYYLTHAEIEILRARAAEIASLAGPRCALVEYGSGAGLKVRLLLNAMDHPIAYVPIDISGEQLDRVSTDMKAEYPHLSVLPLHADYTADVELPPLPSSSRTIGFFPGSTIGNFHPDEATEFLARIRRVAGDRGALLLGVDRVKPAETLNAAYNDSQGVTAAFNRNVLRRINRELGADFRLEDFEHRAWYNEPASRIEMHLVSRRRHTVTVAGTCIHFDRGESVWTESSYKYDFRRLQRLVTSAGFSLKRLWTDDASQFWVAFLETA